MMNDPITIALIVMAGAIVYLYYRLNILNEDIENITNAHNEFVKVTQENAKLFQDAIYLLAEDIEELMDETDK